MKAFWVYYIKDEGLCRTFLWDDEDKARALHNELKNCGFALEEFDTDELLHTKEFIENNIKKEKRKVS